MFVGDCIELIEVQKQLEVALLADLKLMMLLDNMIEENQKRAKEQSII